jgi:hypothetical protein
VTRLLWLSLSFIVCLPLDGSSQVVWSEDPISSARCEKWALVASLWNSLFEFPCNTPTWYTQVLELQTKDRFDEYTGVKRKVIVSEDEKYYPKSEK